MTQVAKISPVRERVNRLEIEAAKLPQVDCPVRHYFVPGLFAREMTIPAGTVVIGAVHKVENIIVVSMGRLQIVTEDGTQEVKAGDTFTCKPGAKNAVHALEESRWTNFMPNPTDEKDTYKLAEMFTHSKASELLGGVDNKQLLAQAELEKVEA